MDRINKSLACKDADALHERKMYSQAFEADKSKNKRLEEFSRQTFIYCRRNTKAVA